MANAESEESKLLRSLFAIPNSHFAIRYSSTR